MFVQNILHYSFIYLYYIPDTYTTDINMCNRWNVVNFCNLYFFYFTQHQHKTVIDSVIKFTEYSYDIMNFKVIIYILQVQHILLIYNIVNNFVWILMIFTFSLTIKIICRSIPFFTCSKHVVWTKNQNITSFVFHFLEWNKNVQQIVLY